jgi:hypothetical protein
MTETAELDQLLIDNLSDLDTAAKRIEDIGNEVFRQLRQENDEWSTGQGWRGVSTDTSLLTGPLDWEAEGEKEAWFYLSGGPGDPETGEGDWPYFWLTRYLGVGNGQLCLWLNQKVTGHRKWKPLARSSAEALASSGFHLSDAGNFYLPCSLDPAAIGSALGEGDLSDAMAPFRAALDRAAEAKPHFDALFDKARNA